MVRKAYNTKLDMELVEKMKIEAVKLGIRQNHFIESLLKSYFNNHSSNREQLENYLKER